MLRRNNVIVVFASVRNHVYPIDIQRKGNIMNAFVRLVLALVFGCAASLGLAANEVRLLKAESVVDQHYASNAQSPRFDVVVANLAFQKQVFIHLKTGSGQWLNVPLSYSRPANNGYEVWTGTYYNLDPATGAILPPFDPEFAVKYVVNGQTYWDNNGGANYHMGRNSGSLLIGSNVYEGWYRPNAYSLGGNFSGWVTVRNIAFAKNVSVVYTTNNWASTRTANATFASNFWLFAPNGVRSNAPNPGQNGFEEWNYTLNVGSATRVQYAIRYNVVVNGVTRTYWDNNFGRNYEVSLTPQ